MCFTNKRPSARSSLQKADIEAIPQILCLYLAQANTSNPWTYRNKQCLPNDMLTNFIFPRLTMVICILILLSPRGEVDLGRVPNIGADFRDSIRHVMIDTTTL